MYPTLPGDQVRTGGPGNCSTLGFNIGIPAITGDDQISRSLEYLSLSHMYK